MDKEGGMKAVKELDGNHMAGSPKPLSVQPYVSRCDGVEWGGYIFRAEMYQLFFLLILLSHRRGTLYLHLSKPN